MQIKMNGELKDVEPSIKIEDLIEQTQKNNPYYVVAVNYNCILPQDYKNIQLKEGDEIEIVSPMQGG